MGRFHKYLKEKLHIHSRTLSKIVYDLIHKTSKKQLVAKIVQTPFRKGDNVSDVDIAQFDIISKNF